MKIIAFITIVTGKGIEVLPDQTVDLPEAEAKSLIERGFAKEVSKQRATQQPKPQTPKPPVENPPLQAEDEPPENGDNKNEQSNGDEEGNHEPLQQNGNAGQIQGQ